MHSDLILRFFRISEPMLYALVTHPKRTQTDGKDMECLFSHICSQMFEWKGSVKKKMQILSEVIENLDKDKEYWKKLFDGVCGRWQWVCENGGRSLPK